MNGQPEPRPWAGLVHVGDVWDEHNNWWVFVISSDPKKPESRAAKLDLHQMILEWCVEQFGPMSRHEDTTGWYMSHWDALSISNPAQAMAFKLRWC